MRRVIITGVSGFIGQALAAKLLERGTDVWGVCRNPDHLGGIRTHPHFHMIQAEFQEYRRLPELISEQDFDAFFHFAWQGYGKFTDDYKVQTENIVYSCEAAYTAVKCNCRRFVFADSSHEYLKSKTEHSGYCSIYGAAKKSAREFCQVILNHGQTEFCGVLFANIFGPGDRSSRSTNTMLGQLLKGQRLSLVSGEDLYDWTFIDDCVDGIIAAATKGRPDQVYYVGSGRLRPFREIITEVRDIVAPQSELNFGTYPDSSFVDFHEIDTWNLYRDTGYMPSAEFRESIQKTVEWVRQLQKETT